MMEQDDETEQSAIEDFLHTLEAHRKNCEAEGKYVEAEVAKNRLDELKTHEEKRRSEAMKARHISDMLGVEESHMLEFKKFNGCWEKKMKEYEEQANGLIQGMKDRHMIELQIYQEKLNSKHINPKFSAELLDYRKIEEHLVKKKNYEAAYKTKEKADELESIETDRWMKQRLKDIQRQENNFKKIKRQELAALQKRIQTGRDEQKKQKKLALQQLLQRYKNVKKELELQQNVERSRGKQITVRYKRSVPR